MQPSHEPMDLAELARDVVAQLVVLAEERGVEVDIRGLSTPLCLSADPVMLRQAVINVLDNAIKFTRPGTRIVLSSVLDGGEQQLVIDDAGPGIPQEERGRVLERFYRIDRGDARGGAGAGLGLAIVQWAVSANRGRLIVAASPAGGARIVMAFPRV